MRFMAFLDDLENGRVLERSDYMHATPQIYYVENMMNLTAQAPWGNTVAVEVLNLEQEPGGPDHYHRIGSLMKSWREQTASRRTRRLTPTGHGLMDP